LIALVLAVGLTGTVVAMDMHGVLVYISYHLVLPFLSRWRFMARHLPLNGLPGAAHRSGSPTVARGSQPLRISGPQGNQLKVLRLVL